MHICDWPTALGVIAKRGLIICGSQVLVAIFHKPTYLKHGMIKLHSPRCKFLKGLGEERNLQSTSVNKTNFIVCEKGFENLRLHLFFYPNNLQLQWNLWGFKWAGLKIKTNSHSGFNNSWLVPLGFSNIQNKRFSSKQRFNSKQFQILHMQNFTSGQELIFSMNFVIACCLCIGPTLVCAAMSCKE